MVITTVKILTEFSQSEHWPHNFWSFDHALSVLSLPVYLAWDENSYKMALVAAEGKDLRSVEVVVREYSLMTVFWLVLCMYDSFTLTVKLHS